MAKQVMPSAELERRESDVPLTNDQFLKIGLFATLKKKPSLDKFPGALVLRRYQKGEVIFRQGEAGWTAFYILTSEDLLAVEGKEKAPSLEVYRTLRPGELSVLLSRVEELQRAPARDDELRTVATVNLAIAQPKEAKREGWFKQLQRRVFHSEVERRERPLYIPIDGPRDLDYQTLQSSLYEGDLFGEMSCLYRTPRSATIVATRDCYMLEMLRNILDQIQKDPEHNRRTQQLHKKRIFEMYLRPMPLFRDLDDGQYERIREKLDLVTFEAGKIICDEHERPDCMYIIRGGLVRVVKKVSALLSMENIRSWQDLCTALREGEQQPAGLRGKIWQLLPEKTKTILRNTSDGVKLPHGDQLEILYTLNDLIKAPQLADAKEFQEILKSPAFVEQAVNFPTKPRKDWSDQDLRRFHRLLVETIYGRAIRVYRRRVGPDCVLSYSARGEYIGEMGLIGGTPRLATCLAHGQPQVDSPGKLEGQVELVKIPGDILQELMETSPGARARLGHEVSERLRKNRILLDTKIWDDTDEVLHSQEAERLGLIQGQRLMLIDLDRCTRCDECVKACVNTHDDGRSRLFLDGPRFDKYLVPTTCRSCLDPVCMVGCPVGSIHRGNNGQIEIEDWCIGCGLCANNCPYGSIQMHDIGIIPEGARGWRVLPSDTVSSDDWHKSRFNDSQWALADAPFSYDRNFHNLLAQHAPANEGAQISPRDRLLYFRFEFRLSSYLLQPDSQFKLELTSTDADATLWINGQELRPEKAKAGKRDYWLPPKAPAPAAAPVQPRAPAPAAPPAAWRAWQTAGSGASRERAVPASAAPPVTDKPAPLLQPLCAGRNVIAVRVKPTPNSTNVLLDLRLDALTKPPGGASLGDDVTVKLATQLAVVCDLCSSAPGRVPACVNACPHDAAMRVDARSGFPSR